VASNLFHGAFRIGELLGTKEIRVWSKFWPAYRRHTHHSQIHPIQTKNAKRRQKRQIQHRGRLCNGRPTLPSESLDKIEDSE
jgi:hypothetical protein